MESYAVAWSKNTIPEEKEGLTAARQHHHDRRLMFVRRGYLIQVAGGRHATIEQPKHAMSWKTKAPRDLPGRRADFSQCGYGAQCMDSDGIWKPVQKNTSLLTTKQAVQDAMSLQCQHDHEHCPLEGAAPGYGSRTRYLGEYQPALAATLAAALAVDEKDSLPKMNVTPQVPWSSCGVKLSKTPFALCNAYTGTWDIHHLKP